MILTNFTVKITNFNESSSKHLDFSIGLIIESEHIDSQIASIFHKFRLNFYIIFVLPITCMIFATFLVSVM